MCECAVSFAWVPGSLPKSVEFQIHGPLHRHIPPSDKVWRYRYRREGLLPVYEVAQKLSNRSSGSCRYSTSCDRRWKRGAQFAMHDIPRGRRSSICVQKRGDFANMEHPWFQSLQDSIQYASSRPIPQPAPPPNPLEKPAVDCSTTERGANFLLKSDTALSTTLRMDSDKVLASFQIDLPEFIDIDVNLQDCEANGNLGFATVRGARASVMWSECPVCSSASDPPPNPFKVMFILRGCPAS